MKRSGKFTTYKMVFVGIMAAIIYVVTMFRFPLLGSKVHFANAMCLLSGLLFGPLYGGLAAGLGSALNDALYGGYDVIQSLITFVMKFAMAWVCAKIAFGKESRRRIVIGSIAGAFSYVALYMGKTFMYQRFVYGFPPDAVWATMLAKLPASVINAVFALIVTPILYAALRPTLAKAGILDKLK